MRNWSLAAAAIVLAAFGGTASAAPGYVVGGVELLSGPGEEYPPVASLPPGTPTEIYGCLPGWSWCDVAVDGARGWAPGSRLQVVYENRPFLVPGYGAEAGLPVVGFEFGNYWNRYYRDRPWYSRTDRWDGPRGDRGPPPGRDFRRGDNRGYEGGPGRGADPRRGPGPGSDPGLGPGYADRRQQGGPRPDERHEPGPGPRGPEGHDQPGGPGQHGPDNRHGPDNNRTN